MKRPKQTRRTFLKRAALASLAAGHIGAAAGSSLRSFQNAKSAERQAAPPNILLVVADGLGSWMLECYGNREIDSPSLNRLAAEGVRFDNSFACCPSGPGGRATLLTGRTPLQHGLDGPPPAAAPHQKGGVALEGLPSEIFLSDILANNGFACGYFGEWGLGPAGRPQHAFHQWYVPDGESLSYDDPVIWSSSTAAAAAKSEEKGYLPELIQHRAIVFMEEKRRASQPWFAVVSHRNPRPPLEGHPDKYYDLYSEGDFNSSLIEAARPDAAAADRPLLKEPLTSLRKTAASIAALDEHVGVLLDYVESKKLSESTLVVFTSTSGFLLGHHGYWSDGLASNPPNMYEEVLRVPLLARWLRTIPSGRSRREVISTYDFVPSILDLLRLAPPKNRNFCGRSFWPIATSRALGTWDNRCYGCLRGTSMLHEGPYKLVLRQEGAGPNELWDLAADPAEHQNRVEDQGLDRTRQEMTRTLAGWTKKYGR